MYIDAHHHLWKFDPVDYDWIDDSMAALKKDFLIRDLEKTLHHNGFSSSIAVQARQSIEETLWLLELAQNTALIKGVVGWIDLKSNTLSQQLDRLKKHKKLVGFRHVIQGETDPDFMQSPDFIRGLQMLADKGYRYDLLIFSHQLPAAIKMLEQVPHLHVVIDHIAKPDIKSKSDFNTWQQGMGILARNPKCYCKLSGMVTEADWLNWQLKDFHPFMQTVLHLFGPHRIMFGSDWPVCLVAAEYSQTKEIVLDFVNENAPHAKDLILGQNAQEFYQL
ncbi:amidohydrolase family protein [Colwellia psychrerythraea]|uniref:Amidohydrolase 2 n=1 Tax=Colwellia psychrerythraea TaxID=28229 RepID=A0A099KQ87_COLPS|nr:amidohydrolase family protein [Colwellia psychrerythraea]KGJ92606.1 amidohydrolase 2 [Colwellia psychrerythraea]